MTDHHDAKWQTGSALITSLIAVAVLGTFAVAALGIGMNSIKGAAFWISRTKALYAAESGVAHAIDALIDGKRPQSLQSTTGFPAEDISYHVSISYPFPRAADISSQGSVRGHPNVSREAKVRVRISGLPLQLFDNRDPEAPDGIIGSACERGQYQEVTFDRQVLTPPPHTGPGSKLRLSGRTYQLGPGAFAFESVTLNGRSMLATNGPAWIYVNGDVTVDSQSSIRANGPLTLLIRGNLEIRNASVLQADGPMLVYADSVKIQNGRINPSGPMDIFISGDTLEVSGDSQVGTDPPDTVIYLTTDNTHKGVIIQDSARIYGGIYAPGTPVSIVGKALITGAVVGCPVTVDCEKSPGVGEGVHKEKQKKQKHKKCPNIEYNLGTPDYNIERGTWGG